MAYFVMQARRLIRPFLPGCAESKKMLVSRETLPNAVIDAWHQIASLFKV
jgi:hypothetical protein